MEHLERVKNNVPCLHPRLPKEALRVRDDASTANNKRTIPGSEGGDRRQAAEKWSVSLAEFSVTGDTGKRQPNNPSAVRPHHRPILLF